MVDRAVPLLWTGGWDSTFRLLTLLLGEGRAVQPYYIVDRLEDRPGVPEEREAMRIIRSAIAARNAGAAARLGTTIECDVRSIPADELITRHYEACLRHAFIGGQYEWLARYCMAHDIQGMELAIHRDDKARELLVDCIDASHRKLHRHWAGDSRYELFKYFEFPLFDMSKRQMLEESCRARFEDLMQMTWFCHRPRNGRPCGTCNPCIYTIEEGLGSRVPSVARARYHFRVVPRVRHWLVRRPQLYLAVRALYRRVRVKRQASALQN